MTGESPPGEQKKTKVVQIYCVETDSNNCLQGEKEREGGHAV